MPDERPDTPSVTALAEAIGGPRGILDSALPAAVFVVTRLATDSLNTAILVSLAVGLGLLGLRTQRGEPLTQVWSGFFGLVIAVVFARITGSGEGFFLPGIAMTGATGVAFLGSLFVGRPLVGVLLAAFDPRYAEWRTHPGLYRACWLATVVWTVTFGIRVGIASWLYAQPGDNDGLLLVVINVVKYTCIAVAAVASVVLVRRSGFTHAEPDPEPADEPAEEPTA